MFEGIGESCKKNLFAFKNVKPVIWHKLPGGNPTAAKSVKKISERTLSSLFGVVLMSDTGVSVKHLPLI